VSKSRIVLVFSMAMAGLAWAGCAGNACDDLEDKQNECCEKAPDEASKETCLKIVEEQNFGSVSPELCESAVTVYVCSF
jgi:hypothetical protein